MKKFGFALVVISLVSFGLVNESYLNYLPESESKHIIHHQYYSYSFQSEFLQAEWVAYQITTETAFGNVKRTNSFKEDPLLDSCNTKTFYPNSGFDRGHLCPAGSMAFNQTAMSESFYMSNMSPQLPGFNRGIWKKLETQVRTWGYENDTIYVITGPVLTEFIDTIGNLPVPKYYYKVILDYRQPELKAIGFVMENTSSSLPLKMFTVTIDSVENLTGIDFFPNITDSLEDVLESSFDTSLWSWTPVRVEKNSLEVNKYRCDGITSSGNQCSRTVTDSNSYCWQHQPDPEPMVWVCGKSKVYHTAKDHRGLKRCKKEIIEMKLSNAIELGLRKCRD